MHGCLKSKIQSDGSIDKVKLIIVVRGNMQNKELVGDTWSPTFVLDRSAAAKTRKKNLITVSSHGSVCKDFPVTPVYFHIVNCNNVLHPMCHLCCWFITSFYDD